MPSEKVLEIKKQQVASLKERIDASVAGVVVDYKGISVATDTQLRKELREAGVEYSVVKNTLLKRAIEDTSLDGMSSVLEGTTAIATDSTISIKTGYLDGEVISLEMIDSLAKLPSREILLATVCNAFNAPIAAFARAIQAIVDKDGEPAPAAE